MNPFKSFKRYLLNFPGWRTSKKIVVFESDDWGSIRIPSRQVLDRLRDHGFLINKFSFNRYDSLASEEDLVQLFEVLQSVKDSMGNPAILTANTIVANPDFKKIRDSDFKNYFFEPFTETLKRYPEHSNSFSLWKEGISKKVFIPEFHGREHLNVIKWMEALKNDKLIRKAFDYEMIDISDSLKISSNKFVDAFNFENATELKSHKVAISQGLDLFQQLFGYKSKTFIAPCNIWSNELNETLYEMGVKILKSGWFQLEPMPQKEKKFTKYFHYTGQRNNLGQIYFVRNAHFEPSQNPSFDFIEDVLSRAKVAFLCGKPLIIGVHRLNFIGYIEKNNRDRNLNLMAKLLKELISHWPDIEFMSSNELSNLILRRNDQSDY